MRIDDFVLLMSRVGFYLDPLLWGETRITCTEFFRVGALQYWNLWQV